MRHEMIDGNTPGKSKQIKWLTLAIIYFVIAAIWLVPFLENYSYSNSWTHNLIFNGGVMPTVAGLLGAFSIFQYSSRLKEPNDRPMELNSKPAIGQAYRREKIKICRRVALISVFVLVVGSVSAYLSLSTKALNPPGGITIGFVFVFLWLCRRERDLYNSINLLHGLLFNCSKPNANYATAIAGGIHSR